MQNLTIFPFDFYKLYPILENIFMLYAARNKLLIYSPDIAISAAPEI